MVYVIVVIELVGGVFVFFGLVICIVGVLFVFMLIGVIIIVKLKVFFMGNVEFDYFLFLILIYLVFFGSCFLVLDLFVFKVKKSENVLV